jgi:hypothetical protein
MAQRVRATLDDVKLSSRADYDHAVRPYPTQKQEAVARSS